MREEPMSDGEWWMVWSNEHRAWWKPGGYGYTTATHKAGRFTRERAEEIVAQANIILHDPPHEVMVLAPDADMMRNDLEAT